MADFIRILEKKQEVWLEMMVTLVSPQQYYNPTQRLSPYKLLQPTQLEVFSYFQSQQCMPQLQLPWQPS